VTLAGGDIVDRVAAFSRFLRERGVASTPLSSIDAARAVAAIDSTDRTDVRLAFRSIFVSRAADLALFDALFDEWWGSERQAQRATTEQRRDRDANPAVISPLDEPQHGTATALTRWASSLAEVDDDDAIIPIAAPSTRDATSSQDFASYTSEELGAIEAAATRIVRQLRARPSRRWRSDRRGRRLDPRRIVRLALATGGDPIRLARRERALRRTKLVVLCDVSGSMDLYSRFLLQVVYALQHAFARVETFAFSTRVVRITESLSRGTYREALAALTALDSGWSGGTKIGESIETVRTEWPRLFDRRTAVIVLSDGWDTGDPDVLGSALEALGRRVGRIIWLNPLLGSPSYEPLTRGMQAALPHIDIFAPAHNLGSLEQLARHLSF
jgi:uncharacterized protein with von Willebrand factor type A (vWA) domain